MITNEAVEMSPFYGRVSLNSFRRMVDVVYINVAGSASPTLALPNGIGVALLCYGEALRTE